MKDSLARIPWSVLLALFLGYVAFDYYTFTTDEASPLLQKKTEIETVRKENAQMQVRIKAMAEFERSLDVKRAQLRELAGRLDELKGTLTEDLDVPGFIKLVVTEAKKIGLNVMGLKPKESKTYEYYAEQTFEMSFRGVYVQLIVFFQRLSNIQKIVRAENFALRPMAPGNSRYVDLEGSVELKAYRYVASKADTIGRDAPAAPAASPAPAASASGGHP